MTLDNEKRHALIQYRLELMEEAKSEAHLLLANNKYRGAINRIYYAMFYAISALALSKNTSVSRYSQLIGWFNRNYIKTGILDKKFSWMIQKAFDKRSKGDYEDMIRFSQTDVEELYADMVEFTEQLSKHILSEG